VVTVATVMKDSRLRGNPERAWITFTLDKQRNQVKLPQVDSEHKGMLG
jgi:hypothetical protein